MTNLTDTVRGLLPDLTDTLRELVAVPSVSADGYPPQEVHRSAELVRDLLADAGAADARLLELDGALPAVLGTVAGPPGAPTVLLYAHHDVQPPGPATDWTSPAFEAAERDGRLYGRGASDDKAGVIMHLGALRAFAGTPPVTIKVFVEGEEEVGSPNLPRFLEAFGDELACDVIVIGDSGNWAVGTPALTTSLRGLVSTVVEVRTAAVPGHSGMFGGAAPDALMVLSRVLASLHDDDGRVAVEGLHHGEPAGDLVVPEQDVRGPLGTVEGLQLIGEGSLASRLWTQPCISVLAIDAPPVAEAINALVPAARAKVSMRIAPGQDTAAALTALQSHLAAAAPWGAEVTFGSSEAGDAFELPAEGPAVDAWRSAMREAWGSDAVDMGVGGSIPFVAAFSERFPDAAILLTGPGDPTSSIHAPNESQDLVELGRCVLAQTLALATLGGAAR
jgi:acetylornithine deacetylase/succinyl-diaminopimelate desuccinylase-like protein